MTALCEFKNIFNPGLFLKLPWNFSYVSLKLFYLIFLLLFSTKILEGIVYRCGFNSLQFYFVFNTLDTVSDSAAPRAEAEGPCPGVKTK